MKKKVFTTLISFFALTVMACSPVNKDNQSKEESEEPVASSVEECKKHTWGKWETDQEFPCVEGTKTRVCEVCGKVETQKVPAGAHDFSLPVVTTAPTDKEGVATQTCSVCGHQESIAVLPTQDHTWVAASVTHAQGDDEVDASYETCSCSQMRISWDAQDSNKAASSGFTSAGKFTDTGDYVEYKFYSPSAMKARLWVKVADRSSDSQYKREDKTGNQSVWYDYYNGPGYKYGVKVNDAVLDQEAQAPVMLGNEVLTLGELVYTDFTITSSNLVAPWFTFDVKEGQNSIRIERSLGYSVSVKEFYVIGA